MNILVGYTGFVGSNIYNTMYFDYAFNSINIVNSYKLNPDLLVYAGIKSEMYIANKFPKQDLQSIYDAIANIKAINPKKLVLISTIAVYDNYNRVYEDDYIDEMALNAYGKNRLFLEKWVQENIKDYLILRLPAIFGDNIKKNFLYDYLNIIPQKLSKEKFIEVSEKSKLIRESYAYSENGFYECLQLNSETLKQEFENIGFTAVNFSDSRSTYQFYPLTRLSSDLNIAIQNKLNILNLAVEPIHLNKLVQVLDNKSFQNHLDKPTIYQDFRTKYDYLFNGKNGYILNQKNVIEEIRHFIHSYYRKEDYIKS